MSSSLKGLTDFCSKTMRSSFAPAEFCRRRFSRASGSKSRRNMAQHRFERSLGIAAIALTMVVTGGQPTLAQDSRDRAVQRAMETGLRTGDFHQAAALL